MASTVFAAFMIVVGLHGAWQSDGESRKKFDTIEACQAYNITAMKIVIDDMASRGVTEFDKVDSKCLPDIGQTADDVWGVTQGQYEAPTPSAVPEPSPLPPR